MSLPSEPLLLETVYSEDARGNFSKPFALPSALGDSYPIREIFWTTSSRGAIRGMHFQLPGAEIAKLVWVSQGSIVDVVIDLRQHAAYGATTRYELDNRSGVALFVPRGFAHGFQALEDDTIVNYAQDGDFSPKHDAGVRWDSFDFAWPLAPGAISVRDREHPSLGDFRTPFMVVP